jgi:hypothetical protein
LKGAGGQRAESRLQLSLGWRAAREARMTDFVEYLLANPIILAPLLLVAAMLVFALLRKLLKLAAIVAIAGVLYVLLVEYFGGGL